MKQDITSFFHDFRQELLINAEAVNSFALAAFMEIVTNELTDSGFSEGFEFCHYRAQRGIRVDGYWFDDEGTLDLFIADFDSRESLTSLNKTDFEAIFKRLINFFQSCIEKNLADNLEITSPEYGLAQEISDRKASIRKLRLILCSERTLSERVKDISDAEVSGILTSHHIWDMSRLHRLRSSRGHKEILDFNFEEMFGKGIPGIPAHLDTNTYESYLIVMPGNILADLYENFGARLLEQNVRTFLQARGNVNKGIRATILNEPEMFFAYNNGITATAQKVETKVAELGLIITTIKDLQIVNGGQTTASLFHTRNRDKADLSQVFVQMKLTVIDSEKAQEIVPKISEYANTQNKVNAADFFSNHPFHVRMEEFSRRLWAPAQKGAQRETRWFYERARGQYADSQSTLSQAAKRKFKAEHPSQQKLTKTDLAKFENVWDEHPMWVNRGAQKNFSEYAKRIGREWDKSSDNFNELYFKKAIARTIIFRTTEKLVSSQSWYNGGYRANIVAYTLAMLSEIIKQKKSYLDYESIWEAQEVNSQLKETIEFIAKKVNDNITKPPQGISNISEWCKKQACWDNLQQQTSNIAKELPSVFFNQLITNSVKASQEKNARITQKIDNGIEAQKNVIAIKPNEWANIQQALSERQMLTSKELSILNVAKQIPNKIPTESQSFILLEILERALQEGLAI